MSQAPIGGMRLYHQVQPQIGRTWYFPVPPGVTDIDLTRERLLLMAWARRHRLRVCCLVTHQALSDRTIIIATRGINRRSPP